MHSRVYSKAAFRVSPTTPCSTRPAEGVRRVIEGDPARLLPQWRAYLDR